MFKVQLWGFTAGPAGGRLWPHFTSHHNTSSLHPVIDHTDLHCALNGVTKPGVSTHPLCYLCVQRIIVGNNSCIDSSWHVSTALSRSRLLAGATVTSAENMNFIIFIITFPDPDNTRLSQSINYNFTIRRSFASAIIIMYCSGVLRH